MVRALVLSVAVSSVALAQAGLDVVGQAGLVGRLVPSKSTLALGTVGVAVPIVGSVAVNVGFEARANGFSASAELTSTGVLSSLDRLFFSLKPVAGRVPLAFVWGLGGGWGSVDGVERWQLRASLALEVTSLRIVHVGPFVRYQRIFGATPESWISVGLSIRVPIALAGTSENDRGRTSNDANDKVASSDDSDEGSERFRSEPDADRDGLLDANDRCPNAPEDRDGFQDDDGCPDPDNDHDGRLDVNDRCPNEPEDLDGFRDDDGCPDPDNDHDGQIDVQDFCPNDAEDRDGFQDDDGCPDPDNDRDGRLDGEDSCPNDAEDLDGFQDEDGCPEQ